jgi:phosphatidylglycerophosphate synthase
MKFFTEYKNSLKMIEVEEVPDIIFYRPLAFLLVKLVSPTGITPNNLTFAAIIIGVTAGCFYSFGTHASCICGALFYLLFNIIDCSDGQLARLKKNGTPTGRLIDGISDYLAGVAVYTGIAIGYANKPDQPSSFLILLALSGISIIIQEALVDYYRTRFMDYVLERKSTFDEGIEEYRKEYEILKNQKGKWFDKIVIGIYLKYSNVQRKLAAKRKGEKMFYAGPRDYFRKNRIIIRFWVFMGPTMKISTLIICSLFCRFDIYFWITIGFFSILGSLLWIIQRRIDKSFLNYQQ